MGGGQGAAGEWTSEGGPNGSGGGMQRRSFLVGTDGYPPVIHRDTYRWYVKSERAFNVNLGGIAEAAAFVPVWDRGFFYFTGKCIL